MICTGKRYLRWLGAHRQLSTRDRALSPVREHADESETTRPCVKQHRDTEARRKVRVAQFEERLARGGEDRAEYVAGHELAERPKPAGQREHAVEVPHRKQPFGARSDPLFPQQSLALWTVPIATRVVRRTLEATRAAHVDVPAELCGPTQRYGRQRPPLRERNLLLGLKCNPVVSHNLADVEAWPPDRCRTVGYDLSARLDRGCRLLSRGQSIQRARGLRQRRRGNPCMMRRRHNAAVTEQHLDDPEVFTALEQVRRKAVAQDVGRCLRRDTGLEHHGLSSQPRCIRVSALPRGEANIHDVSGRVAHL